MTLLATQLPGNLQDWLRTHAEALDTQPDLAAQVLPHLAAAGLLRAGVPADADGPDTPWAAVEAIAAVARASLTAAFVFWGQRTFVDYLLAGDAPALRARLLPDLLDGRLAGATGLSNAMKFLAAIEELQLHARPAGDVGLWRVSGTLPWVTNLASAGFVVAAAVAVPERPEPAVVAIGSRQPGVRRSADLQLLALRGSATAAVELQDVPVDEEAVIAHDGRRFLCQARPRFLAMQCGLSFGLAQAALQAARETGHAGRGILAPRLDAVHAELLAIAAEMRAGLEDRRFETAPAPLFAQRVRLAALVQQALELELLATGGRAYLVDRAPDFGRRWREAAFIPIVTPSLTQLQTALAASSGTRP